MISIISRFFRSRIVRTNSADASDNIQVASPREANLGIAEGISRHLIANFEGITVTIGDERGRHQLAVRGAIHANIDLIFQAKMIDICHVEVGMAYRNNGHCRRFTQRLHDAGLAAGFEKISVRAVRDGRVAWAALGFRPTPAAWASRKAMLMHRFNTSRGAYPTEIADLIDHMISEDDTDVFPVLANINRGGNNRSNIRKESANILSGFVDWEGEFLIGDQKYIRFLFI